MNPGTELLEDLRRVLARGDEAPNIREKMSMLHRLRATAGGSDVVQSEIDGGLLMEIDRLHRALRDAETSLDKAAEIMNKLSVPPWFPAAFIERVEIGGDGPRALVYQDRNRVLVSIAETVDLEALEQGDEVFLNVERNTIMERAPQGLRCFGETAVFERRLTDGRLVLRHRDDEVVVYAGAQLREASLKFGDLIRWDPTAHIAYEKIDAAPGRQYLVEDVPDLDIACIGGQTENLERLQAILMATLLNPGLRKKYRLGKRRSMLLVGPPGCGKTLMARVVISAIQRDTGKQCRICIVKPGQFEDPYVGVTQKNIRQCFKALADAAEDGYAVLFLDEVEAIGRIRGGSVGHHSDKFLNALLAEIEGFSGRANVAIIAATNRPDLIDPAFLERLSEIQLHVNRPRMAEARAIFGIHLDEGLPFHPNGTEALATRDAIIDTAISRFFSPNADNKICTLRFRDGSSRDIFARDLISGRIIEQTCHTARQMAFTREQSGGESGVRLSDMESAVADALARLNSLLTPRNCHAYLSDLPHDVDVVAVEKETRPTDRPSRYMHVA